jgi:cytidyltransferase-like protein
MILLESIYKQIILEEKIKNSVALVPGSFKPPHAGHLDMVKKYSDMADKVIVIISDPKSKVRKTSTGTVISPDMAEEIWKIYIKAAKLNNVDVVVSDSPSPIAAAYGYVKNELNDGTVIFGASTKGDDYKRWLSAPKWVAQNNPAVEVLDPKEAAVEPYENISATDIRNNIDKPDEIRKYFPKELSDDEYKTIIDILN